MAIFASTTLGTSDPSKALSIKALEARAQALAQANAKQEMPTSLPSPWQGASLVANQAADAFAAKQADWKAQEQKAQLAQLMGQIGPEGPNPQQLAGITARDTDLGKTLLQQQADREAAKYQAQIQQQRDAAKAQSDKDFLAEQERLAGARPQTDAGKLKADLASGRISQPEFDTAWKKLNAAPAAEQKAANEQQDLNIELQGNLASLKEAQALLNADKVYSGGGAEYRETAGKWLPDAVGGFVGVSEEKTKGTQKYNQIMNPQVLDILNRLKGASSDRDMKFAIDTLNDKSADIETKKAALNRLLPKVEAHLRANEGQLKELGREPVKVEMPPSATGAPTTTAAPAGDANAAAREWLAANPNDPRAEAVRKKLGM